jgi:hypothetical protein
MSGAEIAEIRAEIETEVRAEYEAFAEAVADVQRLYAEAEQ